MFLDVVSRSLKFLTFKQSLKLSLKLSTSFSWTAYRSTFSSNKFGSFLWQNFFPAVLQFIVCRHFFLLSSFKSWFIPPIALYCQLSHKDHIEKNLNLYVLTRVCRGSRQESVCCPACGSDSDRGASAEKMPRRVRRTTRMIVCFCKEIVWGNPLGLIIPQKPQNTKLYLSPGEKSRP